VSSFDPSSPSPSKSRRRLAAWLAFGVAGLATGAVWASGFATETASVGDTADSPAIVKGAPATPVSALATAVAKVDELEFDWTGLWGSIAADTHLFKVDLSGGGFTGKTYNVAVLLANDSDLSDWATMQLKIDLVASPAGDCTDVDYDTPAKPQILNSDNKDAGVYWSGANVVNGGAVYCVGIDQSAGDDAAGTFLRAETSPPGGYPRFVATVDRAS
jgi:hypothetical protein